ncbi:MAG: RagB/SusD family nutrient uptake outer membrane protein [Chitinophagaceae bacterium]
MKKLIIILSVVAIASCKKDFLEKTNLNEIAAENFWKNEQDAALALNGVYDVLQERALYSGNLNGTGGIPIFDGIGDNCFGNYKFEGPGNFMEGNVTPGHGFFGGLWGVSYRGIFRANTAIKNIPTIPDANIRDSVRKVYVGQALFLRALFYTNLAIYFRDVPLILEPKEFTDAPARKSTYAVTSAQIVKDLNDAIAVLPVTYPAGQFGYATKGAALALLARFQLYNKEYQAVVDATSTLMTLGYDLHNNYSQLFTEQGELSREIIFSVRFFQDGISNNTELFSATFLQAPKINIQPMRNLVNDYNCTDGRPITSSPLYSAANPKANRDPRLSASIYFRNDIFLTDLNRAFTGNTATGFGQKKYIRTSASPTGIAAFSPGGQDFYLLRYADVLLMRAEALVELNQLTEVYSLINRVRARVGMPAIENVVGEGANRTQGQLKTIVQKERRVEMAFEGLRYFDLKRWGQLQQAFQRATADNVGGYSPLYQAAKANVFPVPESELNANGGIGQIFAWQ